MSRFISVGTPKHDSSKLNSDDSNPPHDDNSPLGNASGNEDYPVYKRSPLSSISSRHRSTYDLSPEHDVAQSLGSMSFHSPIWSIGPLPSATHSPALLQPIPLSPLVTPGDSLGDTQAAFGTNLLGADSDSEELDFDVVPASPVEEGVTSVEGFRSTSSSRSESPGSPLGRRHLRRSSSRTRSERGAETWLEMEFASDGRPSPYPSRHTSPLLHSNELPNDDSSNYGGLLRVGGHGGFEGYSTSGIYTTSSAGASGSHDKGPMASLSSSFAPVEERSDTLLRKPIVASERMLIASGRRRKRERKFNCHICGDSFTSRQNLENHIRSHLGVKQVKCRWPGCGKAFGTSRARNRHERQHAKNEPLTCGGCGKEFADMNALNRHLRSEGGADCLKSQEVGGSVGGLENKGSENEKMDAGEAPVSGGMIVATGIKGKGKGASVSGIPPSPLLDNWEGDDFSDLLMDMDDPRSPLVTKDSQTAQSSEQSDASASVNRAHEISTKILTRTDQPKVPAVGDRAPFTLKSRHMTGYIVTMSAEQQEAFGIEMAQRRLRERNARKAAAALGAGQT